MHQGAWDGAKGVCHINAADTVTQWEVIGCGSRISEAFLMPVLEARLHQFPFPLLGFRSDNGNWKSCMRSSQRAGQASARTMPWQKGRMEP
ncbi:MAG: hypothetical protein EBY17_28505 [Acidobacteriia bacterium]|nr:hypothetical protein [Terriglobia bacterium]